MKSQWAMDKCSCGLYEKPAHHDLCVNCKGWVYRWARLCAQDMSQWDRYVNRARVQQYRLGNLEQNVDQHNYKPRVPLKTIKGAKKKKKHSLKVAS